MPREQAGEQEPALALGLGQRGDRGGDDAGRHRGVDPEEPQSHVCRDVGHVVDHLVEVHDVGGRVRGAEHVGERLDDGAVRRGLVAGHLTGADDDASAEGCGGDRAGGDLPDLGADLVEPIDEHDGHRCCRGGNDAGERLGELLVGHPPGIDRPRDGADAWVVIPGHDLDRHRRPQHLVAHRGDHAEHRRLAASGRAGEHGDTGGGVADLGDDAGNGTLAAGEIPALAGALAAGGGDEVLDDLRGGPLAPQGVGKHLLVGADGSADGQVARCFGPVLFDG